MTEFGNESENDDIETNENEIGETIAEQADRTPPYSRGGGRWWLDYIPPFLNICEREMANSPQYRPV